MRREDLQQPFDEAVEAVKDKTPEEAAKEPAVLRLIAAAARKGREKPTTRRTT